MAYSKTTWVNNETKLNADNMNKIENGIETNSNNMPNGINTDSNGYLILEHNGVEITGQNKLVKIGKYNSSTNTFEIDSKLKVNEDLYINTGMIISGEPNNVFSSIELSDPGFIYLNGENSNNDYIEFAAERGFGSTKRINR